MLINKGFHLTTSVVLLLIVACLVTPSVGWTADIYKINRFEESYDDSVDVSGSILASFMISGSLKYSSPDALFVYLTPEHKAINLSLVSIDGRYNADVSIDIEVESAGWVRLTLPSLEKDKFKRYEAHELVVFAYADSRDKRGRYVQEVFPVSWGPPQIKKLAFSSIAQDSRQTIRL